MFRVQPSGIHGQGLFAERFIPADTVIGHLEGSYTTQDGAHVLWITEEQGFRVENELRFINHANEPNAAYFDDLTVMSLCDIQPGEEITHDYLGDGEDDGVEFDDEATVESSGTDDLPDALPEVVVASA